MKKMTKKWDLETSNAEMELKIGIYAKKSKTGPVEIFLTMVKVNDQRSKSTVNG